MGSRITKEDTEKLQGKITRLFSKQQKATWRWDRPWLTNFQTILFVEGTNDVNEVFRARVELQRIVDENDITVKGQKIEVGVEATQERKKWLTAFLSNVHALELATGLSSKKGEGKLHIEFRDWSVSHMDFPNALLGKLNRANNIFEFDASMLEKIKLTEEEVRAHLKATN